MPVERVLERISLLFPHRKIFFIYTHKNGKDRFGCGLKANTEISYFSFSALKNKFKNVFFLRLEGEKSFRINAIRSQDIVIGHVGETYLRASEKTQRLIAFYPWSGHLDRSGGGNFNCLLKSVEQNYLEKAVSVILLTSEFNKQKYLQKRENFWYDYFHNKKVRIVHQPIDLCYFPRIKWEYTTSHFFYVGNNAHMKCLDQAKKLVQKLNRTLVLYGCEGNFLDNLNEAQVAQLPSQADFFIQPGMWEAQCVSILEAAARGFIPIVTRETGYPYDHPFLLRFGDFEYNQTILENLLHTSASERKMLGDQLYTRLVNDENHNSWDRLTDVLVEEVGALAKS